MALQYSVPVNNARLDATETTIGANPKLCIYTGSVPANCAAAASGTKLLEITLPADWMADASAASKGKQGTWSAAAMAAGVAGYFRVLNSAGTVAHLQGTCGQGTGDLQLDNTNIANGQVVTVNTFTINAANT